MPLLYIGILSTKIMLYFIELNVIISVAKVGIVIDDKRRKKW